ncbi:MAG: 30S ribosomal protein S6 [Candidatus Pacebacteria bacterium]|nr:30S ribosomal protein S6 [Candidatus Paceibacterota bacterium]
MNETVLNKLNVPGVIEGTRKYELSFISINETGLADVRQILASFGLSAYFESSLNVIRLAYPIKKKNSATFGFVYFLGKPELVNKISEALRFNANILRFLVVTPPIEIKSRQERFMSKDSTKASSGEDVADKVKEVLN